MEFDWSAEQLARYENTRKLVSEAYPRDLPPRMEPYDKAEWLTLGEIGVLGPCLPTEYGGQGLGALDTAHIIEAFGRACADTGLVFASSAHLFACGVPIAEFGTDEAKKRFLPDLISGRHIAGNAITEEQSGSDVSKLQVTATQVPGGWLLNGEKSFISNGPAADVFVTYATSDPEAGHLGQTAFVLPADAPGLRVGEMFDKMGFKACPAGGVTFEDCFVPDEHVLGLPGMGATIFQHSMGWERSCLFAGFIGMMDRLIDESVAFARQRKQFGRRISEFQAVSHRIVDMKLRLEGARLLLYRACWEMDQGRTATMAIALSKLAASEAALANALDAVRVFGGRGFQTAAGIEAAVRDTVPSVIVSGTSEMQKQLVAKELGL